MKTFLYRLCQCTWGLPQTLFGAVVFLICRKHKHYTYRGAVITEWNMPTSLSVGMFIFITARPGSCRRGGRRYGQREVYRRLLVHEYGHTIQSLMLGPLYLPLVALPSALWCNLPPCKKYRRRSGVSYYTFFTESWADRLGERVTEEPSMGRMMNG